MRNQLTMYTPTITAAELITLLSSLPGETQVTTRMFYPENESCPDFLNITAVTLPDFDETHTVILDPSDTFDTRQL